MKRNYIYIVLMLVFLTLAACQRQEPANNLAEDLILLQPCGSDVATKGFLNAADLPVEGTTVKIYDDLTGFTGKIDNTSYTATDVVPYIDDTIEYGTSGWAFGSGIPWRWTRTGTHHFYGWLTKDRAGLTPASLVSGVSYNSSTKVLSVPAITFTKSTTQFDFSYSDKVAVDVENNAFVPTNSVEVPLKHLFSALAVSIQNGGNDVAHINSVALVGLKNNKSATINFSDNTTAVNMTAEGSDTPYLITLTEPLTLNPNGTKYDLVAGSSLSSGAKAHSYMMWPQTPEEVFATKIVVTYSLDGVYTDETETELEVFTKELLLKETGYFGTEEHKLGMDAGKKYYLNLQFKAKSIDLQLIVMPWDYTEFDLDFAASSISAKSDAANEGVLWMETLTYDTEGHEVWHLGSRETREVTLASDRKVRGSFYIGSPHSGSWQVTTYTTPAGYEDRFRVEPSSGDITSELITEQQGKVIFFIYPNGPVDIQVKLHFNLAFRFNGETQWRDGNTEFNRKDWRVVREP